ncbi:HAMP domain-containing histidine kinase [Leucobacter insecticola]|uniref:histidine kinase n=1 Tax=Leucobacter insecticola TaxID=2714934 RepID=A0A6G8FJU1_9MICO|nr:HAMP domain-containing sensor histidine kinase [Leucobacter insecticola]QIM16624.1 HAMP domain-containing histidine kinase [Leucobacter insecticola]
MTERATLRSLRPAHWSLRTRLVAALAFTVIVLSGTIALIGLTSLRASLIEQLDGELGMLSSRVMITGGVGVPGQVTKSDVSVIVEGPGVAAGAIVIRVDPDGATGAYLDTDYSVQMLSTQQLAKILNNWPSASHRELSPGEGLGGYRFALEQRDGATVVTGLPLTSVERTISSLGLTMATVAVLGCLLFGSLAAWYMRHELRPLELVAAAAEEVANTSLEHGSVELQRAEELRPGSAGELTRLVSGFNAMIDQVTHAFRARHESEKKMRRFVADASHELRTPLASIRGYSELTKRMGLELPQDVVYALGRIESESVRMTALVEDLLLLARIDEGKEIARDPVDLVVLISDAVNDAAAAGSDHEWIWEAPEEDTTVIGDGARLQQVMVNLLANARVHTPAGTSVRVSAVNRPGWVSITVRDDGPGIPEEQLPSLFERFTRGDSSRTRVTGSTGLGLAITQAIAQAHGGSVRVTSSPGDTCFTVELPRG